MIITASHHYFGHSFTAGLLSGLMPPPLHHASHRASPRFASQSPHFIECFRISFIPCWPFTLSHGTLGCQAARAAARHTFTFIRASCDALSALPLTLPRCQHSRLIIFEYCMPHAFRPRAPSAQKRGAMVAVPYAAAYRLRQYDWPLIF